MFAVAAKRRMIGFGLALASTVAVILAASPSPARPKHVVAHSFAGDYIGPVWVEFTDLPVDSTTVVLRWGQWARRIDVTPAKHKYLFAKTSVGNVSSPPLTVESRSRITASFGEGFQPPADAISVNDGWVQSDSVELPA